MSCGPVDAKFRLLDRHVGWSVDAAGATGLTGFDDAGGIALAPLDADAVGAALWRRVLPPRLARSGAGWILLMPQPQRLLHLDACRSGWEPLWPPACQPVRLHTPVAIATWGARLAILDKGAGRIVVCSTGRERVLAEIDLAGAQAIAYSPCGALLAVADGYLYRYGPAGDPGAPPLPLGPVDAPVLALAADADGGVWLVTRSKAQAFKLWHAPQHGDGFKAATLAQLFAAPLPDTGLVTVKQAGFCLHMPAGCWSWDGDRLASLEADNPPLLRSDGSFTTLALDSGMPRCHWHRVRLDADLPAATILRIEVASADHADAPVHESDWQSGIENAADFLIDQPPGRYLFVRITLHGDGARTPLLRRVRIDFPRLTSLDALPAVYRDNPRAEDFTGRFLSLFDASMGELDDAIEQFPAAFDVAGGRSELLPWLAGFLDLVFDPAWDAARQRAILSAVPRLYRMRGTVAGLRLAIRLLFDIEVVIDELASARAWGSLGRPQAQLGAALGAVRLFGRARARFALGRSGLGSAPLNSYGDPDRDPVAAGAFRFRVLVPPSTQLSASAMRRLVQLVESQKPAHTQVAVRAGGSGFVVGLASGVGIDSVLGPLAAPLLGTAGTIRLGRMSVLWPGRRRAHAGVVLGRPLVAGIQTLLE